MKRSTPPHRIADCFFDGQGAVCGICGERVGKALSGKGLRHLRSYRPTQFRPLVQ